MFPLFTLYLNHKYRHRPCPPSTTPLPSTGKALPDTERQKYTAAAAKANARFEFALKNTSPSLMVPKSLDLAEAKSALAAGADGSDGDGAGVWTDAALVVAMVKYELSSLDTIISLFALN